MQRRLRAARSHCSPRALGGCRGSRRWLRLLLPGIPANPIQRKASSMWRAGNPKEPGKEVRPPAPQHTLGSPFLSLPGWLVRLPGAGSAAGWHRAWGNRCRALCVQGIRFDLPPVRRRWKSPALAVAWSSICSTDEESIIPPARKPLIPSCGRVIGHGAESSPLPGGRCCGERAWGSRQVCVTTRYF